ncbi:MAG: nucleotidyltransferase, partial [Acidobacteria bacterium]|nr:nucleotidyltransferase [Acidobacteriota bacterium]
HIGRARNTEEFLEERHGIPIRINPAFEFRIKARVVPRDGFRTYELRSRGNKVGKSRNLKFSIARSTVPEQYQLYWKVRNFDKEAINADCIRGQVVKDDGTRSKDEPTAYRGRHYVECYAVKDGVCVAMDRQPVIIV